MKLTNHNPPMVLDCVSWLNFIQYIFKIFFLIFKDYRKVWFVRDRATLSCRSGIHIETILLVFEIDFSDDNDSDDVNIISNGVLL